MEQAGAEFGGTEGHWHRPVPEQNLGLARGFPTGTGSLRVWVWVSLGSRGWAEGPGCSADAEAPLFQLCTRRQCFVDLRQELFVAAACTRG